MVYHDESKGRSSTNWIVHLRFDLILCRKLKSNDSRNYVFGGLYKVSEGLTEDAFRLDSDSYPLFTPLLRTNIQRNG